MTLITNSSELIIGKHYADSPIKQTATILEFVKSKKGVDYFKYISGSKSYAKERDGLIRFTSNSKWFLID